MPTRVRLVSDRAGQNWILLTLCLAVFVVNVSTTIVNIALPSLVTELDASTRDLLWIVDAFNLAFAALVLAAGSLSDRFGRRRALLLGLALFAAASLIGAWSSDPGTLIAWRTVAGVAAAVVYPVTLSILSNVFTDRRERVRAIGIWGAATGLSVAIGPVVGGALLEHYWWGSILLFNGAAAVLTLVLALRLVPDSRDPSTPPLDVLGLVLSTLALGTFVYTIIEAPDHGWASTRSLVGFGVAAALLVVFVLQEIRVDHPMLDVRLFSNLRFTAASGAVTGAFFALFGFLFLVTQYFQSLRDYGALETGLRMLPVAGSLAVAALIGPAVAMRFGSKLIVALGLLSMTVAFGWASFTTITTPYGVIVAIMVFLGAGIGLTSAPATEAIMGVVSPEKAGMGSAVNDATREIGGTLGVAILGTVALTTYRNSLDDTTIPGQLLEPARASIGAAVEVASRASLLGDEARAAGEKLLDVARLGFMDGFSASCVVAACTTLVAAVLTLVYLPAHPEHTALESELEAAQKIQRIRASGRTSR